jgi:hypothetical protein
MHALSEVNNLNFIATAMAVNIRPEGNAGTTVAERPTAALDHGNHPLSLYWLAARGQKYIVDLLLMEPCIWP